MILVSCLHLAIRYNIDAFDSGSELGFFSFKISLFGCNFPGRTAAILFLSIFGHEIAVLKCPDLFQGKELQVTRFKVM